MKLSTISYLMTIMAMMIVISMAWSIYLFSNKHELGFPIFITIMGIVAIACTVGQLLDKEK